jgi:hypothetical protein
VWHREHDNQKHLDGQRITACLRHNRLEFEMRVGEGEGGPNLAEQPRLTHVQPPALPISRNGRREIAKDQALTEASHYLIQLA